VPKKLAFAPFSLRAAALLSGGRLCQECRFPIPARRRRHSLYCSPRCGWRYRQRRRRERLSFTLNTPHIWKA